MNSSRRDGRVSSAIFNFLHSSMALIPVYIGCSDRVARATAHVLLSLFAYSRNSCLGKCRGDPEIPELPTWKTLVCVPGAIAISSTSENVSLLPDSYCAMGSIVSSIVSGALSSLSAAQSILFQRLAALLVKNNAESLMFVIISGI